MKHTLTTILALYILCIGGGVNIYHYCCNACESHGHAIYSTVSCEEVHARHNCTEMNCGHTSHVAAHQHTSGDLCSHISQESKHCDVHHVDAPQLDNISVANLLPYTPAVAVIATLFTLNDFSGCAYCYSVSYLPNPPPIVGGRAIIALKRSFLI